MTIDTAPQQMRAVTGQRVPPERGALSSAPAHASAPPAAARDTVALSPTPACSQADVPAPSTPASAPFMVKLRETSRLHQWTPGSCLRDSLRNGPIEVSAALLGGPVGHVLHLALQPNAGPMHTDTLTPYRPSCGAVAADFRSPGSPRAGTRLQALTHPPRTDDLAFALDSGKVLTVNQHITCPELSVGVRHLDGLHVEVTWESGESQKPTVISVSRGPDHAALVDDGRHVHRSQRDGATTVQLEGNRAVCHTSSIPSPATGLAVDTSAASMRRANRHAPWAAQDAPLPARLNPLPANPPPRTAWHQTRDANPPPRTAWHQTQDASPSQADVLVRATDVMLANAAARHSTVP